MRYTDTTRPFALDGRLFKGGTPPNPAPPAPPPKVTDVEMKQVERENRRRDLQRRGYKSTLLAGQEDKTMLGG